MDKNTRRQEWRYCLGGVLILGVMYLLLHNGKWFPGTDTAFYISIARNLALGKGYVFNGGAVAKVPPLWPCLLAGAMKISSSFWFLNLIPTVALLGAMACWYWVLRRLTSPNRSFLIVLLSGTLFFTYTAAVQLRTEAVFCLAFSSAILLAMQISESKPGWWRLPVLALCVMAMGLIRWPGAAAWVVVAGSLLSRQIWPKVNRQWVAAAVTLVIAAGTFTATYYVLTKVLPRSSSRISYDETGTQGRRLSEDMDYVASSGPLVQSVAGKKVFDEAFSSLARSGKWISSLFWMPMYLGVTSPAAGMLTNPLGWLLIVLCGIAAFRAARQRQWIWIGVILYCGTMIVRCRLPNPRYLMPVAPLLLLGTWMGLQQVGAWTSGAWGRLSSLTAVTLLGSIALCNVVLWGADLYIARSPSFYQRYYAGESELLIGAARYLNAQGTKDGEVAVSIFYNNLGRRRTNGEGLRSMHLLTGHGIRSVPDTVCIGEPNRALLRWAARKGVKYYLYRPPVSPWRAWHFKIPWVQRMLTGNKDIRENPGWVLYELQKTKATRVELPAVEGGPTRAPGLEGNR